MSLISYIIIKEKPYHFCVQKWEANADKPTVIYNLQINRTNHILCDCPAGAKNRPCKHLRMLIVWLEKGMPEMFEIADGEV
jgi:hypothetical protein